MFALCYNKLKSRIKSKNDYHIVQFHYLTNFIFFKIKHLHHLICEVQYVAEFIFATVFHTD